MAETTAFSSSGSEIISQTIELEDHDARPQDIDLQDYYEIDRTADEILKGSFRRIALQFPDPLLCDSVPVYRALRRHLREREHGEEKERELYVLADTSYGSCCVDEVAAQHVDADAVVHYGHACLSQTSRLPVIYVFGKRAVDPVDCAKKLADSARASASSSGGEIGCGEIGASQRPLKVQLRFDVAYAHRADNIAQELRAIDPLMEVVFDRVPLVTYPVIESAHRNRGSSSEIPDSTDLGHGDDQHKGPTSASPNGATNMADMIFYVGPPSLHLTNILLTNASTPVYSYDPRDRTVCLEGRSNRLLMRRYAAVQRARDADVIGILVGTLGVASYLPMISHLRTTISRAQKKSYTVSVGKLSPSKLANFAEIECWVLVACPENSVVEAKEFLRPIVTPYELGLALRSQVDWTGRYVLDFEELLGAHAADTDAGNVGASKTDSDDDDEGHGDPDRPQFSLVTGKYRHARRFGDNKQSTEGGAPGSENAVILRNQDGTLATVDSAAGQFLQTRTFRGLETRIGQDAPSIIEQGRSGIARGYAEAGLSNAPDVQS